MLHARVAIRVGISGWRYAPWRGVFYPSSLPQAAELRFAGGVFPTLEINGSFYSLQRPQSYALWYQQTPPGFVFALKGGRYITHMLKLRNVERPLANFFASGVLNLREKLGPVLWQFPPAVRFDAERFEAFFALLPTDTAAALSLARRRDRWMKGRTRLAIDQPRLLRHAIEIRHESFLTPAFVNLLRKYRVAFTVADTAGRWPLVGDVTADFLYLRLHGDKQLYTTGYGDRALERWAGRIRAWEMGGAPDDVRCVLPPQGPSSARRDVYCYFDNTDGKLRAPTDAKALMRKLGLTPGTPPRTLRRHRRTGRHRPTDPTSAIPPGGM
ncbi:MAG: DUF72 domain-containing protein [Sinobacteraceae bacterium]|nr:DUF72 domain-containing protein [Nevskiaceae bacterium]MBV9317743.1 DUF72 domain-containing protein [Gammaproteobacteria bacterium]